MGISGWFDNDTIYTSSVARVELIDKENRPDILKEAIVGAVTGNYSISDSLLTEALYGFQSKVDKYYRYGSRDPNDLDNPGFFHGLPTGTSFTHAANLTEIKRIIEEEVGEPINVIEHRYGELKETSLLNPDLASILYTYTEMDKVYNRGFIIPVDLVNGNITVTNPPEPPADAPAMKEGGTLTTLTVIRELYEGFNDNKPYTFIFYRYPDVTGNTYSYTNDEYVSPQYLSLKDTFIFARYTLVSDPTRLYQWSYNTTAGIHPSLVPTETGYESPYYPIAILRDDKRNLDEYDKFIDIPWFGQSLTPLTDSEEQAVLYHSTQKLLGYIDLDVDSIMEAVKENPDIEVIDDVFVSFSVDIQTQEKAGIEYLWTYFNHLAISANVSKALWESFKNSTGYRGIPLSVIEIAEGGYGDFHIEIGYHFIDVIEHTGILSKDGKAVYVKSESEPLPGIPVPWTGDSWDPSSITFSKQTEEDKYISITVYGLKHKSFVHKESDVYVNMQVSIDRPGSFYIPLDRPIVEQLGSFKETDLFMESLCLIVYAIQETEVKWYQTKAFQILVSVVAIVVSILTLNPAAFLASLTWTGAAIAAAVIIAGIYIARIVLDWLVTKVGGIFAILIAIVIIVLTVYFTGYLNNNMWAEVFLKAVSAIVESEQRLAQRELEELQSEIEEFQAEAEAKQEAFEEATTSYEEEWGMDIHLDPNIVLRQEPMFFASETPTDYFNRVLDSNPGVKSLDVTQGYVDSMLMLPTIDHVLNA